MMAPPPHMGYGYPYFAPYPQYWVSQSSVPKNVLAHQYFQVYEHNIIDNMNNRYLQCMILWNFLLILTIAYLLITGSSPSIWNVPRQWYAHGDDAKAWSFSDDPSRDELWNVPSPQGAPGEIQQTAKEERKGRTSTPKVT